MMEKASHFLAPHSISLLFNRHKRPHSKEHFSLDTTTLLSPKNMHTTATDIRHLFTEVFRDFLEAHDGVHGETTMLEGAAAHLMGNSPSSWDKAYDAKAKMRPILKVLALYPSFKAWVMDQARRDKGKRPRNPLA